MPTYVFFCKKCDNHFEELCDFDSRTKVRCPGCRRKPVPGMTAPRAVVFTNPKGTSREDNFEYVAETNLENAKKLRVAAERANKGALPYRPIDDSRFEGKIV